MGYTRVLCKGDHSDGVKGAACRIAFIALLSCTLVLAALSASAHADGSDGQLKPVKVQLKWRHQYQFAGYYAAKEQGYFHDVGLDVELIERTSSVSTSVDRLMGGQVDFAVTDSGSLLYRAAGAPLVALASIFQHSPSILITRSDITLLNQLRGKRVMLGGGYANAELITMIRKSGVDIDEVNVIPTNTSVDVLIEGGTDAYNGYTTNEPFQLKAHDFDFNVFRPRDFGVDFYGDILVTTESILADDPEMVAAFREASLRGWQYAVNNPAEMVELIQQKYNTQNKSYEHLLFEAHNSNELVFSEIVPIGYMNKDRWLRIEDVFRQHGLLKQPINYSDFLYQKTPQSDFSQLLHEYRLQIAAALVLLFGSFIALHNIYLRRQVAVRTRELDESRLKAEVEARTDWLTGLPNRRHFIESVKQYIGQAERRSASLAMLSLDIDHFKKINDTYGHAAGDAALIEMAKQLKQHIRKGDVVARLGGEEFSTVCLDTDESRARLLAERVSAAIVNNKVNFGNQEISCTVSIGIAFWEPGDSYDHLLNKADEAMYLAKASGRNQIKLIKPSTAAVTHITHE